jgi:hypothetical protein
MAHIMKPWLEPNLADSEYKYQLFSWWDGLNEYQRTKSLIKYLVTAGIDVDGLASEL